MGELSDICTEWECEREGQTDRQTDRRQAARHTCKQQAPWGGPHMFCLLYTSPSPRDSTSS
eukprot:9121250-Prorocentrum_lima.AAC.1